MRKGTLFLLLGLIFVGIMIAGCTTKSTQQTTPVPTTAAPQMKNIVETAVADGHFTTLVAAIQAAKLDGTLSGPGPFTVFAPTDDAFKNLPPGTVDTLLKDPQGQLKQILLYHVVNGKVMAADVVKLNSAKTLQGSNVNITVTNGVVKINDATVKTTDIQTSNGVIHVIDKVLIPPK